MAIVVEKETVRGLVVTDQPPQVRILTRRLLALMIDSLVGYAVLLGIGRLLFPLQVRMAVAGGDVRLAFDRTTPSIWPWFVIVTALYFVAYEVLFAATPGKLLCGLRVATVHGDVPSRTALLIRNVIRPIDFIPAYVLGGIAVALSPQRQRIGDRVARTIVADTLSLGLKSLTTRQIAVRVLASAGFPIAALLGAAFFSWVSPPSLERNSHALNSVSGTAVLFSVPNGYTLSGFNVTGRQHSSGVLRYGLPYLLQRRDGTHHPCTAAISLLFDPVQGWQPAIVSNACLGRKSTVKIR